MIIILTLLALMVGIPIAVYYACDKDYKSARRACTIGTSITTLIIGGMLLFIPIGVSYDRYLDQRAFYDTVVTQYRDCIEIYGERAVINLKQYTELTDFKYEGYQKSMAGMIKDLRNNVARYNRGFIKKRKMNSNIMFSWMIIAPDKDMKLLGMRQ